MTTVTAQMCGHHWWTDNPPCGHRLDWHHQCTETADHPDPCRCRCGAATTRERTDR